ncbi:MAG: hypothetical protein WCO00_10010 [Rhodospirillaceae bacterium]
MKPAKPARRLLIGAGVTATPATAAVNLHAWRVTEHCVIVRCDMGDDAPISGLTKHAEVTMFASIISFLNGLFSHGIENQIALSGGEV